MFWFAIGCIVCSIILWLTSLSGLKFYTIRTNKEDVKSIRILIHACAGCLLTFLIILLATKGKDVSINETGESQGQVQQMEEK